MSSTSNGKNDKIVKIRITAIVVIIGPIAFSTKDDSRKASVQTALKLINAKL